MLEIKLETGRTSSVVLTSRRSLSTAELWDDLEKKGFSRTHFYLLHNGRPQDDDDAVVDGRRALIPKLPGGKGGFGSMLRAIGAQIEKTTNREACRDLSGRRLRDINEEKRLKAWIEKQAERKEEEAERKKRKLERLCAEPKHEFKDKNYDHERSILTERIDDAVAQGFKTAATSSVDEGKKEKKGVKRKTLLDDFDEDIDSDELSSSDDERAESPKKIPRGVGRDVGDSGLSSGVEEQLDSSRDQNSPGNSASDEPGEQRGASGGEIDALEQEKGGNIASEGSCDLKSVEQNEKFEDKCEKVEENGENSEVKSLGEKN